MTLKTGAVKRYVRRRRANITVLPTIEALPDPDPISPEAPTTEQLYQEISLLREERDARRERDVAQQSCTTSSKRNNDGKCKILTGVTWEVL